MLVDIGEADFDGLAAGVALGIARLDREGERVRRGLEVVGGGCGAGCGEAEIAGIVDGEVAVAVAGSDGKSGDRLVVGGCDGADEIVCRLVLGIGKRLPGRDDRILLVDSFADRDRHGSDALGSTAVACDIFEARHARETGGRREDDLPVRSERHRAINRIENVGDRDVVTVKIDVVQKKIRTVYACRDVLLSVEIIIACEDGVVRPVDEESEIVELQRFDATELVRP